MKNSLELLKYEHSQTRFFCFQVFAFNTEEIEREG